MVSALPPSKALPSAAEIVGVRILAEPFTATDLENALLESRRGISKAGVTVPQIG